MNLENRTFIGSTEVIFVYQYQFPFEPPIEDLKMLQESDECTCYIFDTICKNITPAQKEEADLRILRIYYHNAESKLINQMNKNRLEGKEKYCKD